MEINVEDSQIFFTFFTFRHQATLPPVPTLSAAPVQSTKKPKRVLKEPEGGEKVEKKKRKRMNKKKKVVDVVMAES